MTTAVVPAGSTVEQRQLEVLASGAERMGAGFELLDGGSGGGGELGWGHRGL